MSRFLGGDNDDVPFIAHGSIDLNAQCTEGDIKVVRKKSWQDIEKLRYILSPTDTDKEKSVRKRVNAPTPNLPSEGHDPVIDSLSHGNQCSSSRQGQCVLFSVGE